MVSEDTARNLMRSRHYQSVKGFLHCCKASPIDLMKYKTYLDWPHSPVLFRLNIICFNGVEGVMSTWLDGWAQLLTHASKINIGRLEEGLLKVIYLSANPLFVFVQTTLLLLMADCVRRLFSTINWRADVDVKRIRLNLRPRWVSPLVHIPLRGIEASV